MRSRTALIVSVLVAACGSGTGSTLPPAPPTTGNPTQPAATSDPLTEPPASGLIAFQRSGDEGGVFTINADGSKEQRLLHGTYGTPKWSPDGTMLAVYHELADGVVPAVLNRDGSGYRELVINKGFSCGLPAWVPTGAELALECWSDADPGAAGIYLVPIDGTNGWRRLTKGHGLPAQFSADGQRLLFGRDRDGKRLELAIVDDDGSNERTIGTLSIGQMPGFLDDRSIYAVADGAIVVVDDSGAVIRTIEAPERKIVEARLSPDRRFFAFIYDPLAAVAPGLYRMAVDGSSFGPIVHTNIEGVQEEHPDWAP